MKKVLVALMLAASTLQAQKDTGTITVPRSSLTKEQLAKLEASSNWAGLGAEIGAAVNSSLKAVTEQTAKFADTKVGKITMFVVVWKVIGKEILGIFFALSILFIGFPILIWSYRKYIPHTIIIKKTIDANKVKTNEYKLIDADTDGSIKFLHALAALALLGVMALSLFGL